MTGQSPWVAQAASSKCGMQIQKTYRHVYTADGHLIVSSFDQEEFCRFGSQDALPKEKKTIVRALAAWLNPSK